MAASGGGEKRKGVLDLQIAECREFYRTGFGCQKSRTASKTLKCSSESRGPISPSNHTHIGVSYFKGPVTPAVLLNLFCPLSVILNCYDFFFTFKPNLQFQPVNFKSNLASVL